MRNLLRSVMQYCRQHRYAWADMAQRVWRQPGAMLLNVLVLATALVLPLLLYTLFENLRPLMTNLAVNPEISVFMDVRASRADSQAVEARLRADPALQSVDFVAREQALAQLSQQAELADVLSALPSNPLPDAFIVQPAEQKIAQTLGQTTGLAHIDELAARLRQLPKVAHVQLDSAWARRLDALWRLARTALLGLALILGAAAMAVVFNTIRLQVLLVREEIELARLVGATTAFIRRPFLYLGATQGLLAGLAAWAVSGLILQSLNESLGEFARLYAASFVFHPLHWLQSLAVLAGCAALGWLGAWLSVSKHLREII